MNAILRLLLLPLLVSLALPACGQYFFPKGQDFIHYVPNVPGTPNGRIYVGDFTDASPCHFRLDLPPGKSVTKVILDRTQGGDPYVSVTRRGGELDLHFPSGFKKVNAEGKPCPEEARVASAAPVAVGAETPISMPVSNTADSFATTCDGRYAVVVGHLEDGSTPVPVSLVDIEAGHEVDTVDFPSVGKFGAACDDGESVLVVINAPSNVTSSIRRLTVAEPGKLTDTGEILGPPSPGLYNKVFAVPGSKVGVAVGYFGTPGITTFRIPGLQVLDSSPPTLSDLPPSAAVSCAGDKIYLRAGNHARSQINGYTLDPVTGALGDTPFLTINVAPTSNGAIDFGDELAISRDGTRLIVPERAGNPTSPPTSRVTFLDTTTGERVGFFDAFGAENAYPTIVATYSCCAGIGLRLGIQRLASGLIQITATGETGRKYEFQESQNLVAWDKLLEFQMTASPTPYTDLDSQTNSTRFYRLKLSQ